MDGVQNNGMGWLLVLVPALPLMAALVGYLLAALNRKLAPLNAWLGGVSLLASAGLGGFLLTQAQPGPVSFSRPWFNLPGGGSQSLAVPLAFQAEATQLLFILTTALIGLAVLVFAARDRRGDPRGGVFFANLTLFAGAMLLFLAADTLLVLYIAWELMGLCSYLLIAHSGTKEAWRAARQAFWTTRATDTGLLFAVLILMTLFNWHSLSTINLELLFGEIARINGNPAVANAWVTSIALLILLAVVGKAAQWPLSFWLPDAMVAPSPVSALLHAATMVAAGPYLMCRLAALFQVTVTAELAAILVGSVTMLAGSLMALCARDPKRILAYSTVGHLGLVVLSVGVLADRSGYFHLMAHGWFKAALFLGVGYLVYQWAASQSGDHPLPTLAGMAGSARRHPLVKWGILVPAGLSLAGVPFLAGALGKEQVLYAMYSRAATHLQDALALGGRYPVAALAWFIGALLLIFLVPFLTAAYITRLVGILGWGRPAATADDTPPVAPEPTAPPSAAGWGPGLLVSAVLAIAGSIGLSVVYFAVLAGGPGWLLDPAVPGAGWGDTGYQVAMTIILVAVLLGAGLTWYLRVAKPANGDRLIHRGGLAALAAYFREGMYLREFFTTAVGRTGEFLAILAGITDIGLVDWLALRCGRTGRGLATAANWVDLHIVDGLRWWACEFWWILKRLHSRFLQTGQIQFYMFIILVGTVLMCVVILRPLGEILSQILGSK